MPTTLSGELGKVAVTSEYVNTPLAKVMDTPFPSGIESIFYFTDVTRASPGVQASSWGTDDCYVPLLLRLWFLQKS